MEHSYASSVSQKVSNQIDRSLRQSECGKSKHTGRDDRATTEQVLDPRTRMILYRMLNSGMLDEINGCISTGKEANVYHAKVALPSTHAETTDAPVEVVMECAVKVFKTAILVFKDRDKYVSGEFRFRHGYCKSNPRKMVKTWAEKEMRNLRRLFEAGIPCPEPLHLRSHVLMMKFIGTNGWPAPRLKDAKLSDKRIRETYLQLIEMMRKMYQVCHLVHGDLSEYNLLYFNGQLIMIDVSQSVEHEHPAALDFLRTDCRNVTDFYTKSGLQTMSTQELFDFVTSDELSGEDQDSIDAYLKDMQRQIQRRSSVPQSNQEQVDEAVFMNTFIPRSLGQVLHSEREQLDYQAGRTEKSFSEAIDRLTLADFSDLKDAAAGFVDSDDDESEDNDDVEDMASDSEDSENDTDEKRALRRHFRALRRTEKALAVEQYKLDRKEMKRQMKEDKREKRKTKIPKHVKKRHHKMSQQKKR